MKTATASAPSSTRRPSLKDTNRKRAQSIAAQLNTPTADILEMILAAGIEAIERTLHESGRLVLPLEFGTVADIVPFRQIRTV